VRPDYDLLTDLRRPRAGAFAAFRREQRVARNGNGGNGGTSLTELALPQPARRSGMALNSASLQVALSHLYDFLNQLHRQPT
jgi:hypothetical protein